MMYVLAYHPTHIALSDSWTPMSLHPQRLRVQVPLDPRYARLRLLR